MFYKSNNDNDKVKKLDNKIILVEVNMADKKKLYYKFTGKVNKGRKVLKEKKSI